MEHKVSVNIWHVGEEGAPEIVDEVATTDIDETASGGGVVVVELENSDNKTMEPIIAAAIGESVVNPALTELRKVVARENLPPELRELLVRKMTGKAIERGIFSSNGLGYHPDRAEVSGIDPEEVSAAFPNTEPDGTALVMAPGIPKPEKH